MHKYSAKVVIRKDGIKKDGTAPLLLQVFINRQRKRIRIGVYARPDLFSDVAMQLVPRKKMSLSERTEVNTINAIIHKVYSETNKIFMSAIIEDQPLTMDRFLDYFENRSSQEDFIEFLEAEIERERNLGIKAPGTIKNYCKLLHDLQRIRGDGLKYSEINYDFIQEYIAEMKRRGLAPNSITAMNKIFKHFITLAIQKGKRMKNPFDNIKTRWAKTERVFLTISELKKLTELYESNDLSIELQRVLRYFLFMCFTSVRVGDLIDLKQDDVISNRLVFTPGKTKNSRQILKIPLNKYALQMIKDSDVVGEYLFKCISPQKQNVALKKIMAFAGIQKKVTNHTGRHTFATTFLRMGGQVEVLQKIMGHSKIETTMVYVHITNEQKTEQMSNFDLEF